MFVHSPFVYFRVVSCVFGLMFVIVVILYTGMFFYFLIYDGQCWVCLHTRTSIRIHMFIVYMSPSAAARLMIVLCFLGWPSRASPYNTSQPSTSLCIDVVGFFLFEQHWAYKHSEEGPTNTRGGLTHHGNWPTNTLVNGLQQQCGHKQTMGMSLQHTGSGLTTQWYMHNQTMGMGLTNTMGDVSNNTNVIGRTKHGGWA
jgi:hypothetical protein